MRVDMQTKLPQFSADAEIRARAIRLVAFDVDGTLTDGSLYFDSHGELMKGFSVRDGFGLKLLQKAGLKIAIVTGRRSDIVDRRAEDLGFDAVIQGSRDKLQSMRELCARFDLTLAQTALMGDDWPDLSAMPHVGLGVAVTNAAAELVRAAHWVGTAPPGQGAAREFCEWLLHTQGKLDALRDSYAGDGGARA